MKKYKLYIYLSLLTFFLLGNLNLGFSQGCIEILRTARAVYDEGRLHELPTLLESCLKKGFNNEEKTEAYRLLILSYIYQDQPALADQAMLSLLRTNPLYNIDPDTDPNELINLYKTFRTGPIYRIGLKFSGNYSLVNILKTYSTSNGRTANGDYKSNISVGGSVFIEKDFIQKRLALRAEASFSLYKMTYLGQAFAKDEAPDLFTTVYEDVEVQSWAGLGILGKYSFLRNSNIGKKIHPGFILGASAQYLLSSKSSNTTDIDGGESASGADLDFLETGIREKINLSAIAGIGVAFPSGKSAFTIELTYQYGLENITDKNNSPELNFRYGRAMSDLSINTVNLAVAYMLNKYSPKKLSTK